MNKIFACIFFCPEYDERYWGRTDVIAAKDEQGAREVIDAELVTFGSKWQFTVDTPYILQEVDMSKVMALILNDGDY